MPIILAFGSTFIAASFSIFQAITRTATLLVQQQRKIAIFLSIHHFLYYAPNKENLTQQAGLSFSLAGGVA